MRYTIAKGSDMLSCEKVCSFKSQLQGEKGSEIQDGSQEMAVLMAKMEEVTQIHLNCCYLHRLYFDLNIMISVVYHTDT